jgi:hypothetical protein
MVAVTARKNEASERGIISLTHHRKEKIMETAEGTILRIDLTADGEIIFKVRRKDGSFTPLTKEEMEEAVIGRGTPIEAKFSFSRVFSVIGLKKNPIQVYLPLPDGRTICLLFSDTFQYIGSC